MSSTKGTFRALSLAAASAAALLSGASAAYAQQAGQATSEAAQVQFNIPAQPLASALTEFSRQAHLTVVVPNELVRGRQSTGVVGEMSADRALERLIAGSGLRIHRTSDGGLGLVAVNDTSPTQLGAVDRAASSEVSSPEEIVVIGTNIRGVTNRTVPITVIDREDIDASGVSTTARLMETLPQNFAQANQAGVLTPGIRDSGEQGASVNLRGLGVGTTLILLNGRRMAPGYLSTAVDISALPLSAIERVEILNDSASARYGSDAVGGVVNFVLRRDFNGSETAIRGGWADGIAEQRVGQVFGRSWGSGNALLSLEYYHRDLLQASDRSFVPNTSTVLSLLPEDDSYSALFSGRQDIGENVSIFADALYTERDSRNLGRNFSAGEIEANNPQANIALGLDWQLGAEWRLTTTGTYSRSETHTTDSTSLSFDSAFELFGFQVKADGPMFRTPGGNTRVAIGAEWRAESYDATTSLGSPLVRVDQEQDVASAFAEFYIPLFGPSNAVGGIRRLEVSLAGRYDDYSKFGSSLDPQIGVMWEPLEGLQFRASHGTAYRAPSLTDYSTANSVATATFGADPGAIGGRSYRLILIGTDADSLSAENATSYSMGFEYAPAQLQGLRAAFNYYRIEYVDRIAFPGSAATILANPSAFSTLIIRDPTVAQVENAISYAQGGVGFFAFDEFFAPIPVGSFDRSSVDVLVDTRTRNLSSVDTRGFDASIEYLFPLFDSEFSLGITATHIIEIEQRLTPNSVPFDTVDTIYNPPDWRARAHLGWRYQNWAAHLFANYTDDYRDSRSVNRPRIDDHLIFDTSATYEFEAASSPLSGLTISASVQNIFDVDPPRTALLTPINEMGFDATNASPLGRIVSLELRKRW